MSLTASEYAARCLADLPPSILSDPETREILAQFCAVVADVQVNDLDPILAALPDLLDPDDCPAVALDGLMSLCGFSAGVTWAASAPDALKRKLCWLAASIWRSKGLPDGARALYRALSTGQDVAIWDWPWWRHVCGEEGSGLGELPILIWEDPSDGHDPSGEHVCDLHFSDPRTDVDRTRVSQACAHTKPGVDTWRLVWCLLAEPFLQGLRQWAAAPWLTLPACAVGSGEVALTNGQACRTNTGGDADWTMGRILLSAKRSGTGVEYAEVKFCARDEDNYWTLQITDSAMAVGLVRDGVVSVVCSSARAFADDVWYLFDLRLDQGVSLSVYCEVYVDGSLEASGSVT